MAITKLKNKILEKIEKIDDPKIIHEIYRLLAIDEPENVYKTNNDQKEAIDAALFEIKVGKVLTEQEANEQTKEWLNKKG